MGGLPDRWMQYKPMGKLIPGTRFIAFKVPLKETLCRSLPKDQWFTPRHIIDDNPNISLIVDLTNTTRYYDKNDFKDAKVSYVKIFVPGHVVPTKDIVIQFFNSVDKFYKEHRDDDKLIGVHCTHGVNRTGYFICKYMIDKLGMDPSLAIEDVGKARGHPIERVNYIQDLKGKQMTEIAPPVRSDHRENKERENWRLHSRTAEHREQRTFHRPRSQNDQGSSRNFSSDRYSQNDRSRQRPRYDDRPNRRPR